jgi:hypothetical protein
MNLVILATLLTAPALTTIPNGSACLATSTRGQNCPAGEDRDKNGTPPESNRIAKLQRVAMLVVAIDPSNVCQKPGFCILISRSAFIEMQKSGIEENAGLRC